MDYPPKIGINQPLIKTQPLRARRWFDAFIVGSIDPIIVFDEKLDMKFTNQSGSDLFKKQINELIGMSIEQCGALGAIIAPVLHQVLRTNIGVNCDHEIPEEESSRIFQGSYSPVLNVNRQPLGVFCVLREVTDRRNVIRQLISSNKRLEAHARVLEVFDIVSESDLSGRILYVNEKFCKNSGYSRRDLVGKNYRVMNSNTHSKLFFQDLWQTISRGKPWFGEIKNRRKDGSLFWAQTIITPIFDDDGSVSRFLSIQQDITEEREEKMRVAVSALRFRQILDSSPHFEVALDLDHNITFCNKRLLECTGYLEDDVLGKNWFDIFILREERNSAQSEVLRLLSSDKGEVRLNCQLVAKAGATKSVSWDLGVIKDVEGAVYGIRLFGQDCQSPQSSVASMHHDVLGFVSHELKGGLVSIETGLRLIEEHCGTDGLDEKYLRKTVHKLLSKVTSISQISQDMMRNLEVLAQPMEINTQPVSLRTIVLGVWYEVQRDISPSKVFEFSLQIPEDDIVVQWDPLKIEQAERNVLLNAIQYSKPGGGRISLCAKQLNDNIVLSVTDDGLGMPSYNLESMFNAFTRGERRGDQDERHFGIGLKLCRDIVFQHRGHVWVESKENVGTTVFFLIPMNPQMVKVE